MLPVDADLEGLNWMEPQPGITEMLRLNTFPQVWQVPLLIILQLEEVELTRVDEEK